MPTVDVIGSAREIPLTSLRAGSSLRLKNGSVQDDAVMSVSGISDRIASRVG